MFFRVGGSVQFCSEHARRLVGARTGQTEGTGIQQSDANDFLQKPYVPSEASRRVRLVLDAPEKAEI
jgi:hypothetical protein